MNLLQSAVNHYRSTFCIMALILIAGVYSRAVMTVQSNPDITVPTVNVQVILDGISPQDGERLLVRPLEKELRALEGVDEITATATESRAYVSVKFVPEYDIDQALVDVREAVNRAKAELPQDAEEPIVQEISADGGISIIVTISGQGVDERTLFRTAQNLKRKIENVSDVLTATLVGNREEVVEAIVDPAQLEHYGVTSDELARAVINNNRLVPAGQLEANQGRFSVKVPGLIETSEDIYNLPIKSSSEGSVKLGDVAEIRRTFKDPNRFSSVNGSSAITIQVGKRTGANEISTVEDVRAVVDAERDKLPAGVEVGYILDQSTWSKSMVSEMQGNIMTAMMLVMTIIVAALGVRSAIIVGLGVPFSLLFSAIVLLYLNFSFNMMVMFGMLLALGMLIDGAIVITEFADRKIAEGMSSNDAYVTATRRMFWPVVASTATTLAAFLPIMFWPGVAGEFMKLMPVTVFAVLVGSLFYALLFAPVVGTQLSHFLDWLRKKISDWLRLRGNDKAAEKLQRISSVSAEMAKKMQAIEEAEPTTLSGVTGTYARALTWLTQRPLIAAGVSILGLASIFAAYYLFPTGMIFFAETEQQYATVHVRAQGNLSVVEVRDMVQDVERIVLSVPGVKTTYAASGGFDQLFGGDSIKDEVGNILVEFEDQKILPKPSRELAVDIRKLTSDLPGIKVSVELQSNGPGVGRPIVLQLESENRQKLFTATRKLEDTLQHDFEGVIDVVDSTPLPGIEWEMQVDRTLAAQMGANMLEVGRAVQLVTNGVKIGDYRPDDADDEVDIRVRFPSEHRGINSLDYLRVNTPNGAVPISSFVKRVPKPKVDKIERVDGVEVTTVKANVDEGILADDKVKEIEAWLKDNPLDPQVNVVFRGANEEQEQSSAFLIVAMLLALFLMFVLLVTQFNSFYQGILILSAVIMSTAGVLLGLLVSQQTLSVILTGTGIVALAGIVVNNNIVLIDTYNVLKREEPTLTPAQAAVKAGVQRLRPVFLTTITTILGLMPIALNFSVDFMGRSIVIGGIIASMWVPLASAIVYGLAFSTILTLLLTPVLLVVPHRLMELIRRYLKPLFMRMVGIQPSAASHQH